MKRELAGSFVFLAILGSMAGAAQPKDLADVSVDALTRDTQGAVTPEGAARKEGMNLVWYVPTEFWEVSLAQNKDISQVQAKQTVDQLRGIFMVCVVRSQVSKAGGFDFYDEKTVRDNLVVAYTGKDGKSHVLEPVDDLNPTTGAVLGAMKPAIKAAMGKMGQSMYFFVYKDTSDNGKRLVSPLTDGKLSVTLKPLVGEPGGKTDFAFPLNSLFVPRECSVCHTKNMDIHWKFCPICGAPLPA